MQKQSQQYNLIAAHCEKECILKTNCTQKGSISKNPIDKEKKHKTNCAFFRARDTKIKKESHTQNLKNVRG